MDLNIEIKIVDRDDGRWQELWINGRWCCSNPGSLDGNTVAHIIALELREKYDVNAVYNLTGGEVYKTTEA